MPKYDLFLNATSAPANQTVPQGQFVTPHGPMNPNMPPQEQSFQLEVTGVGAVSATVQLMASNDSGGDPSTYLWTNIGSTFTASGTNNGSSVATNTGSFRHYGAVLTAITGTGAKAQLRMSA